MNTPLVKMIFSLSILNLPSLCISLYNLLQRQGTAILENVSLEGAELPGCQGRLQNPGKHCLLTRPVNSKQSECTKKLWLNYFSIYLLLASTFSIFFLPFPHANPH